MADISHGIRPFDMVEAALCASLASYTFIIILDHEIWMKVSPSGGFEGATASSSCSPTEPFLPCGLYPSVGE